MCNRQTVTLLCLPDPRLSPIAYFVVVCIQNHRVHCASHGLRPSITIHPPACAAYLLHNIIIIIGNLFPALVLVVRTSTNSLLFHPLMLNHPTEAKAMVVNSLRISMSPRLEQSIANSMGLLLLNPLSLPLTGWLVHSSIPQPTNGRSVHFRSGSSNENSNHHPLISDMPQFPGRCVERPISLPVNALHNPPPPPTPLVCALCSPHLKNNLVTGLIH